MRKGITNRDGLMIRCQLVASKSKIVIPKTRVTSPRIVNYESLIALNSRLLSRLPASRFGPFISTHTHDPQTRAWLVLYFSRFFFSFFSFLFFSFSVLAQASCLVLCACSSWLHIAFLNVLDLQLVSMPQEKNSYFG